MLSLLRQPDFSRLWLAGLVSIAGDWMLYAALPYFVYVETGSTVATAGMIVAELTPGVVLGSVAGVFVDRWSRKRLLIVANLLQAGVVALLLFVPIDGLLWLVYAVAAAQSAVAAFAAPAESALLPLLVQPAQLVSANSLNALNNRLARLLGLPAGAALLTSLDLRAVVLADCATFLAAAVLVAPIVVPPRDATDEAATPGRQDGTEPPVAAEALSAWRAFVAEWSAGLQVVRTDRAVALVFVVLGIMTFGGTMLDPLVVAWVRDALDSGADVYAGLMTTHAVFGIFGSLLVGRYGVHASPRLLMGASSVFAGVVLLVNYNVSVVAVAFGVSAVVGMTSVASSVGVETLVQQSVRDEYRGRVYGALGASGAMLSLLGAGVGGLGAAWVGVVPMLSVAAGLILTSGVVVLFALPRTRSSRALPEPSGSLPPAHHGEVR